MNSAQPNFLFLFPDQHRPDWLGVNSSLPLRTPNLDRLCERGTRLTNTFTPAPVCAAARACLATGRDYHRCGVKHNGHNTPLSLPTYYQHLRDAGYEVSGVGKFDLHKADLDWGIDGSHLLAEYGFTGGIDNEGKGDAIVAYRNNGMSPKGPYMQFLEEKGLAARHFAMYEPHLDQRDWLNFPAVTDLPDEAYCDNWVAANARRCLKGFPRGRPWHLVVNFVGPHDPFDVTAGMRSRWEKTDFPAPVDNEAPDTEAALARRQNYAAMIENIDEHVGRLIELVEQRGESENTIICYSSDHGEMLGDHGRWGKSVWYTPSTGVPLIVAGPGIQSGVRSDTLVSLHDLAATFLDYAQAPPLPDSDSLTLRPCFEGPCEKHRDYVISGLNDWKMVFDGRYKCVVRASTSPLVFDLQEDPDEIHDIFPTHAEIAKRLLEILESQTGERESDRQERSPI